MTPKEKAEELVCDFYAIQSNEYNYGINWQMAKQCALIAVEEVRNFHYKLFFASKGSLLDQYLDKVKIEIEKL